MLRKFATIFGTIGIVAAGVVIITIMGSLRPKPNIEKTEPLPPSVFYVVAETRPVTLDVVVQGEVRPRTDITLTAQVSGRIVSTSDQFVDGGAFKKGETLIKIEDADYRLAVTRADARVAQAEQALRQERAEADLARRDWEELGRGGTPSDLTLRLPQLAQAKANYDAAIADLEEARLNMNRTNVRAPFEGRVRTRAAGVGQFVNAGAQLGNIFATDIVEIRLPLTDANLATLSLPFGFVETEGNPGPEVFLTAIIGANNHQWVGRIARTEGAIDPTTRQIGAIAVVDDPYGDGSDNGVPLAVGLFVEATIIGRPYDNAITLPIAALYGRDTVYVINSEEKLERRTVTVATSTATTISIVAGLDPGDRVVVSPLRGSDEGDQVTPVTTEEPAPASNSPGQGSTPNAQAISKG